MIVDFDTVLEQVRRLPPEEQLLIIRNLISTVTVRIDSDEIDDAMAVVLKHLDTYIEQVRNGEVPEGLRVVSNSNVLGGVPYIEHTHVPVHHVVIWHEQHQMKPDEIAAEYDLTLGEVYSALQYYYDHTEEIKAAIQVEDELVNESMRQHPSKLKAQRGG